ncbi:MAG: protease HtpX [Leptospiraceae bacterium]|nr:protease HtpX [Leptospiraceae bacterium]
MMFKTFGLLFITNILIMISINIIVRIFGFDRYIVKGGIDFTALAGFCLIWGFIGSFISLFLSKTIAKMSMGVQEIDGRGQFAGIYNSVQRLSRAAGIPMPEVGVYYSPEINAFATGASQSNSLVAVSTGLLENMNSNEVDGVLAHEISHIANGDMVRMTLIQGMVNAFGMFLARVIAYIIASFLGRSDDEERGGGINYMVMWIATLILENVFLFLGMFIVSYFSRVREFAADEGGARLAGKANMIAALENLRRNFDMEVDDRGASLASLKISGRGWLALLSTHPPLEDRIAALKSAKIK